MFLQEIVDGEPVTYYVLLNYAKLSKNNSITLLFN
jgi:hypothetical protein